MKFTVSIQLGIGGFRPFPADFVHEKKYGDCKALSNYMEACLKAIDIKIYSASIKQVRINLPLTRLFHMMHSTTRFYVCPS